MFPLEGAADALGSVHRYVPGSHPVWIFLAQDKNIVNSILAKIGAPAAKIRSDIDAALDRLPRVSGGGETVISPDLRPVRMFSYIMDGPR